MAAQPSRALLEVKLRALAKACAGLELTEVDSSVGAGLASTDDGTARAFYLAGADPRSAGRAVQWAASQAAARVDLLADADGCPGDLARRAGLLTEGGSPTVTVWSVEGVEVTLAEAEPATPPPPLPEGHWALAAVMSEAGARPIDDHGVLIAEVAGLEVGRVVDGDDGPTIDVGVGQADRELSQYVHGAGDPGAGLRRVIAAVIEHRRAGSHHPLTRIARDRWLRSTLLDEPSLIGASAVQPLVPLRPRTGLAIPEPSAAGGRRADDGRPIVVVTMVGVDLDLVPEAADYRHRFDPEAELVLALPERDLHLSTAMLHRIPDARAVALPTPWA